MTHPLTEEMMDKMHGEFRYGYTNPYDEDDMRAAADWQLKQCVAWLEGYEPEGWAAEQMKKDLRPITPQQSSTINNQNNQ